MAGGLKAIPDIPPVLQDASRRSVLIPFVGAGVSVLAGCPTWNELADGALRACIDQQKFSYDQLEQIDHLAPRVKLSIARGLELEHGFRINFAKLIQPAVSDDKKEIGNRVYRALGKLGSTFVTTNYDGWLDTEIADHPAPVAPPTAPQTTTDNTPAPRRRIYEVHEFTPANLNLPKTVFHLHGSLASPRGMIMTTREYITRYRNDRSDDDAVRENRTLTFLDHLFSNKTVLFVGYGLEDLEILEYVIRKARVTRSDGQAEARHFMLQGYFSHQIELMRALTQYYRQCDVQLLPFLRDQKNWGQLIDVLEEYARVMPATAPLNLQILAEMEALLAS
jgi:hypothetical protein